MYFYWIEITPSHSLQGIARILIMPNVSQSSVMPCLLLWVHAASLRSPPGEVQFQVVRYSPTIASIQRGGSKESHFIMHFLYAALTGVKPA